MHATDATEATSRTDATNTLSSLAKSLVVDKQNKSKRGLTKTKNGEARIGKKHLSKQLSKQLSMQLNAAQS